MALLLVLKRHTIYNVLFHFENFHVFEETYKDERRDVLIDVTDKWISWFAI